MEFDFTNFHFLRPLWLFGLPLALLIWLALKRSHAGTKWEEVMPKEVVAVLRISTAKQSSWPYRLWLISWITLIVAAAGPAWVKQAVPIIKNQNSTILVLDLSPSMLAEDLTPNRLIRAKFKLIDLLRQHQDGQVALVAYAGDAHTVSPLTDDPRNLEALLPALHPNIMPFAGSNTEAAIALATRLLKDAGVSSGEILLISDGVNTQAIEQIKKQFDHAHKLSILGVGGAEPSPIPVQGGGFLRSSTNQIVLAKIDRPALREMANDLGGRFAVLSANDSDTQFLLNKDFKDKANGSTDNEKTKPTYSTNVFDAWTDMGHWLVLLVLPLLLVFFRKGSIYLVALFISLPLAFNAKDAIAAQDSNASENSTALTKDKTDFTWQDLWQTRDQQAARLYAQQDYADAADTFKRKDWSAIAHYRQSDFARAAEQFGQGNSLANLYNKGNALALSGSLEQAIKAYDTVLEQDPEHSDAAFNKQIVEQFLQQSQQQNDDQQNQSEQDQSEKDQQKQGDGQQDENTRNEQNKSTGDQSQQSEEQDSQAPSEQQTEDQGEQNNSQSKADDPAQDKPGEQDQAAEKQTDDENSDTSESNQPQKTDDLETSEGEQQKQTQLAESESPPLKDSSEQWLRTIPDDPGGLLRKKFQYQAQQRGKQAPKQIEERY